MQYRREPLEDNEIKALKESCQNFNEEIIKMYIKDSPILKTL